MLMPMPMLWATLEVGHMGPRADTGNGRSRGTTIAVGALTSGHYPMADVTQPTA